MPPISTTLYRQVTEALSSSEPLSNANRAVVGCCFKEYTLSPWQRTKLRRLIYARQDISPLITLSDEELELLPKSGWLRDFVEYTVSAESPMLWLLWAGISVVGAALRRNVNLPWTWYTIYPNHWLIFVGPSGAGKSIASKIAVALLKEVPETHVMADDVTPEALISSLATAPVAYVQADELSVFLSKKKYKEDLVQLLTKLSDSEEYIKIRESTGRTVIEGPCLTMQMCSTPEWLSDSIPQSALGAGFMGRIIIVVQPGHSKMVSLPYKELKFNGHQGRLIDGLVAIAKICGQMRFSPEAEEWYDRWYHEVRPMTVVEELRLSGYKARQHIHLLRLAMVLEVAATGGLELSVASLEQAAALLQAAESTMADAFQQIDTTQDGRLVGRVEEQIRQHRRILHSKLLQLNSRYMLKDKVQQIVGTLIASKQVRTIPQKKGGVVYEWIGR